MTIVELRALASFLTLILPASVLGHEQQLNLTVAKFLQKKVRGGREGVREGGISRSKLRAFAKLCPLGCSLSLLKMMKFGLIKEEWI